VSDSFNCPPNRGNPNDAGGNLTSWNGNVYGYDLLNMMSTMNTGSEAWAYVYTADDERLWALRTDGAKEIWTVRDFGARLLTRDEQDPTSLQPLAGADFAALCTQANPIFCNGFESGDTGGWSTTIQGRDVTDYIWRGDKAFASSSVTGGGSRHFALDHLGTVRLISSDIGAETLSRPTYYPFGQEVTTTTQTEVPLKFTGHERDSFATSSVVDDVDYMKARYTSPLSGRFLSVDPYSIVGTPAGGGLNSDEVEMFLGEPQVWNRYSYAKGNPVKFVDPNGEAAQVAVGAEFLRFSAGGASVAEGATASAAGPLVLAAGAGIALGYAANEYIPGFSEAVTSDLLSEGLSAIFFSSAGAAAEAFINLKVTTVQEHIQNYSAPDPNDPNDRSDKKNIVERMRKHLEAAKDRIKRIPGKKRRKQAEELINRTQEQLERWWNGGGTR
jgi:RHS repeat-associated protein